MKKILIFIILTAAVVARPALATDTLTQKEFIDTAIKTNPSYRVPAREYLAALKENESAHSLEDWNLVASGFWNEGSSAPISSFSPSSFKNLGYTVGAAKYFAGSGTALKIEHGNTRIEGEYPAVTIPGMGTLDFSPPGRYYLSNISVTVSQPLLKNAFGLAAKNALKMADHSLAISEIKLAEDWEDFITGLRQAYLTWQKCHRNILLMEDKVRTVQAQLALTLKQKKFGLSEDLDVVQMKQKLQGYKIMLEQARLDCANQTGRIALLAGLGNRSIKPEKLQPNGLALDRAEALAYLKTASNIKKTTDIVVEIQKTNLETQENARQMDVNLVLETKPNAYAERAGDSLAQIGEYNENTISVIASRPLANDGADAAAEQARAEYEKAVEQQAKALLDSEGGLNSLYTSYQYLTGMLELSENNLELARTRLKLEKRKYDQGRSSVFFVLQAEDDVLQAENAFNEALFAREAVINQIKSLTDRYLIEYKDVLVL